MTSQSDLVALRTRKPAATVLLDGKPCRAIISLRRTQAFGSPIASATVVLRDPPVRPRIGMSLSWKWGYAGAPLVPGFTGEISQPARKSYPNRYTLQCRDVLWRADRSQQVIVTDPLNEITASAAIRYILTHYGGIPNSRISLPTFSASGAAWTGGEWKLGVLTPVAWGDSDTNTGGTSALKAAQEICSVLGYWLYADASGIIRAKQMDRAPSLSAAHTFQRGVDLLTDGSPELIEDVDSVSNRVIILGGNTGIDGAQITDTYQTSHPVLPAGIYQDYTFSSFLIEYVNATDAGAASATETAKRMLKVRSRLPAIVRHRVKANPLLSTGATVGIVDTGIGYSTAKNFFIYELETSLDAAAGNFSQNMTLDGGTGNSGYSTIPNPDASFSWQLMGETADGDAIVEVFLDGSGSLSLTGGVIITYAWSTSTTTYGSTPDTATGAQAVFVFLASEGTADVTLTVTDTTSKTGSITQTIDLTGADLTPPISRVLSVAFGAGWAITLDGGATWAVETSNGDAIAVGTIGAGADDRSTGTAPTYGMLATRGTGGTGLRQTLDGLATSSTNLFSAGGAITSNIWINESDPARVWFAKGTTVYRSLDGGSTATAMAAAPATVTWIMEDAATPDSVFLLAGADMLNATAPTVGWAVLYEGPVGSTARQFVRSRDGLVTWIAYTGAPAGESLQRVETGALADWTATDARTLCLDNGATGDMATLWAVSDLEIWSFDGLTGLDAAQAVSTFPTGSTVQHCLYDPDVDLIYYADFDSVTAGTGAVRKYLTQADQLLLYKEGTTGQQAHMLGFGARVAAPAEFVWVTSDLNPVTAYFYRDGVWTGRPLPISAVGVGVWACADPFNADRILLIVNGAAGTYGVADSAGALIGASPWVYSPVWITEDAGVTWVPVPISTPGGMPGGSLIQRATFSDQTANQWALVLTNGGTYYTAVVYGTGATVTSVTETTAFSAPGIIAGAEGEFVLIDTFNPPDFNLDYFEYVDSSIHRAAGTSVGNLQVSADRLPGTSRAVLGISPDSGVGLVVTSDYRAAQPVGTGTGADAVSAGAVASYYTSSGALYRLIDPTGAATSTQIAAGATIKTEPRVDRQQRARAGLGVRDAGGGVTVLSDDGTVLISLVGPPVGHGNMSPAFEVIVRDV